MEIKLLVCTLFLILLLAPRYGSAHDSSSGSGSSSSSDSHAHPTSLVENIFFHLEDLKEGNVLPLYFSGRTLAQALAPFLPKAEADSIPFSSRHLPYLLRLFQLPPGSPKAKAMQDTFDMCETPPMRGETKTCATSKESMVDFARSILGSQSQPQLVATVYVVRSDEHVLLQNYTVRGVERIPAPKRVSCHAMSYPYGVFMCHYMDGESRMYRAVLTGQYGDTIDSLAICHMDTSLWSRDGAAFRMLGTEPGVNSPVCHFLPADHIVWVPSKTLDNVMW